MTDREVTEMFMEQIKYRDKIIEKLLDERIENRKINKWELASIVTLAFMIFLICIAFILSYFFSDYEVTNINSNTNKIERGYYNEQENC